MAQALAQAAAKAPALAWRCLAVSPSGRPHRLGRRMSWGALWRLNKDDFHLTLRELVFRSPRPRATIAARRGARLSEPCQAPRRAGQPASWRRRASQPAPATPEPHPGGSQRVARWRGSSPPLTPFPRGQDSPPNLATRVKPRFFDKIRAGANPRPDVSGAIRLCGQGLSRHTRSRRGCEREASQHRAYDTCIPESCPPGPRPLRRPLRNWHSPALIDTSIGACGPNPGRRRTVSAPDQPVP